MRRICKNCGTEFEAKTKFIVVCPCCHDKIKHSPTIVEKTCKECGKAFNGGPRAWYCPECRKERQLEAGREHRRKGSGRKIGSTDICERCGKPYIVNGGNQRYCTDCAKVAIYESIRENKLQYQAEYREKHPDGRKTQTVCIICGKPFVATKSTSTCSAKCAKEAARLSQNRSDIKRGRRKSPPEARIINKNKTQNGGTI